CAFGASIGVLMALLSGGSITRPLNRLREGMRRVESGDLTIAIEVDDLGDVGHLQSGFNRMVAGLRERDRLQQLFGHHVGPEVVRRALERGSGLEASECNATVLFVDVIGSTTLASERRPEAVVAMLNALF